MQVDEEITDKQIKVKKHALPNTEQENTKKVKLFSASGFRKQLNLGDKLSVLKEFLNAIQTSKGHDYVFDFLEAGGNCLELLQTLEIDSTLPPVLVFELVTHILLRIIANYAQYESSAYESCRYLLNNYVTIINKMINLSSSTQERKVCLKLLTAMATLSSNLAKDILLHVSFHSTNIELLTKNIGEKESVRDHFIHFLTAFLVNGHYPTLSILLEKKGFITSVITGLQYDMADTVCIVISAMKNHILENVYVSKTAKMKTFNTIVIRDIVNLYNWKGPQALKALQKKNKQALITVDEIEKAKVSECVHDFLLVLCTSHKFGVIFRDHLIGLGKKPPNPLMYTVLESLERPWEHSYACELVIKICRACPDLSKTIWNNLKTYLEPRLTQKWLNALKFAKILLKELEPGCISFCIKELSVYQLSQIIKILVAPLPIIKILIPESKIFERIAIKQQVVLFLLEILKSVDLYMNFLKQYLTEENHKKLKSELSLYISRNFPEAKLVLQDWQNDDECDFNSHVVLSKYNYLENIFDAFSLYKKLCPQLLDTLTVNDIDLLKFLEKLKEISNEGSSSLSLQVKVIKTLIDLDQAQFLPKQKLFSFVLSLLLEIYYKTMDKDTLEALNVLLINTGIFEGCILEVNIWVNGILALKTYDEKVVLTLVDVLKFTSQNSLIFNEKISKFRSRENVGCKENYLEIIENLITTEDPSGHKKNSIKHRYLSPMLLGFLIFLEDKDIFKSLKNYLSATVLNLVHLQTELSVLKEIAEKSENFPRNVKEYILNWLEGSEITSVKKFKTKFDVLQTFTEQFLFGNIDNFCKEVDVQTYPDLPLSLLHSSVFYVRNLSFHQKLTQELMENFEKFSKHLISQNLMKDVYFKEILCDPILLRNISFINAQNDKPESLLTKTLSNIVRETQNSPTHYDIDKYLVVYREKLYLNILKVFKKPQKYSENLNFLQALDLYNLDYDQCKQTLEKFSSIVITKSHKIEIDSSIILDVITYCLSRILSLYEKNFNLKPMSKEVIKSLSKYFVALTLKESLDVSKVSRAFQRYLEKFPHSIDNIEKELFKSILSIKEYNKDNISLAAFLLDHNKNLLNDFKDSIDDIYDRKGVILPLLQVVVKKNNDQELLGKIYNKFEPSLAKALQKPQKAGQHFHQNFTGLVILILNCMPLEKCISFFEKVQKFEVAEVFHVKLVEAICNKVLNEDLTSKQINNIILIFVHLHVNLFKRKQKSDKDLTEIAEIFNTILTKLVPITSGKELKNTTHNETLKLFFKFCLKFGVSGQCALLKSLKNLLIILGNDMEKEDSKLIMEMLLSHSEFLDRILGEHNDVKLEILSLFLALCKNWSELMERNHVPILLAAYRAMVTKCDRIILTLLIMYESNVNRTQFYDFKPYLWGRAAANHYSVRLNMEKALLRQPKMSDVLDILQEDQIRTTITGYPFKEHLHLNDSVLPEIENITDNKCYDLLFLLPVFSQLLAPEQQVQTYKFTKSGALSLTVIGLSSQDKEVRQAACHVLSRFYFHVEARQTGKDNLLWIRYVEAVCKGIAVLPDFKLNNFSAIYLARMALILTQPNHVMYLPLSQHLTAKSSLDFSTVPELYTFLHSSDVNYKEHRSFILDLLKNGLRTEKDFTDFLKSMAFKLFSELYGSSVSDLETKVSILNVVKSACKIPLAVKMLCENHSLLTQIVIDLHIVLSGKEKRDSHLFVNVVVDILLNVIKTLQGKHTSFMVFNITMMIIRNETFGSLKTSTKRTIFEILYVIFIRFRELFSENDYGTLMEKSNDQFCKYLFEYGCQFVDVNKLNIDETNYFLRLLCFYKIQN